LLAKGDNSIKNFLSGTHTDTKSITNIINKYLDEKLPIDINKPAELAPINNYLTTYLEESYLLTVFYHLLKDTNKLDKAKIVNNEIFLNFIGKNIDTFNQTIF